MTAPAPRRPTAVRVGYQTCKIDWITETDWLRAHDPNKSGSMYWGTGTISIRMERDGAEYSEDVLREILLHEVLHTVTELGGLNQIEPLTGDWFDQEETIVGLMTPALLQVLRDNKKFAAYLLA